MYLNYLLNSLELILILKNFIYWQNIFDKFKCYKNPSSGTPGEATAR
jgi:DNA phosphorothioation-dependent restriction protein DptG